MSEQRGGSGCRQLRHQGLGFRVGGSSLRSKTLKEFFWVRPIVLRSGGANGEEEKGKAGRVQVHSFEVSGNNNYLVTKTEYSAREVQ